MTQHGLHLPFILTNGPPQLKEQSGGSMTILLATPEDHVSKAQGADDDVWQPTSRHRHRHTHVDKFEQAAMLRAGARPVRRDESRPKEGQPGPSCHFWSSLLYHCPPYGNDNLTPPIERTKGGGQ